MAMSNFRPESHVAQQMRRDKLRIQQVYNMEHLSVHNVENNNANLLYDPALIASEMLNYSVNTNTPFPVKDQESGAEYDAAVASLSRPVLSHYNPRDAQNSDLWRSIGLASSNRVVGSQSNGQNRVMGDEDSTIGTISKDYGNYNAIGPLGPFTGYATILKSSKYLTPAQLLLDQTCMAEIVSGDGSPALSGSSAFYGSNEMGGEYGGGISSPESHRPDFQQKKAKLMFMHEEICRRYKQYHQQIQMVVSSFETVAGLSGSTPYISFALKTVAKHFRHLKNAISNHLSETDFSSLTTGTTTSCGKLSDHNELKVAEQAGGYFHKQKNSADQGNIIGLLDSHQQQVWRPQRGLPDRAVSVLRAWLFDHFLHPYPTDTDKHMLANQTGLTRNQVSNWFINARVRVWKPMVEEIHMLEIQGLAETNVNQTKIDGSTNFTRSTTQPKSDQLWSQDKRSRLDDIPVGMALDGGSFMGSIPYHRNGLEYGGLGSVSLTLGLRQSVESAAQQQQVRRREHQVMQHFGGHMVHDFVG